MDGASRRRYSESDALVVAAQAAVIASGLQLLKLAAHIDSCAPAHFDLSVLPIYVARVPSAPFTRSYLVTLV